MTTILDLPLTTEERALGLLVGADWSLASAPGLPPGWSDGVDWAELDRLSIRHGLTAMLAKASRDQAVDIPPTVHARIAARRHLLARHALVQQGTIAAIVDGARSTGARVLLLKGHALGTTLFADPLLRECADIDLLTPASDADEVIAVLGALGFSETKPIAPGINAAAKGMLRDLSNARQFDRADHVRVELHYRLAVETRDFADFDDLWRGRRTFGLLGREIATLGWQDTLVFLVIHGAKHGWERWRWLADFHLAARATSDDHLLAVRERVGCSLFDSCVALAMAITGARLRPPARLPRRARLLARAALVLARAELPPTALDPRRTVATGLWQACLVRSFGDAVRQIDRLFVDPRHVGRFAANRGLLYATRPFTVLARRLGSSRARRGGKA